MVKEVRLPKFGDTITMLGTSLWVSKVIQEGGLMDGMDIFTVRGLKRSKMPLILPRSV
jgi:hypothetical protein